MKVNGGLWDWSPRCEEPWTAGQWRDALQKAAASALQRDPSYVRYNFDVFLERTASNDALFLEYSSYPAGLDNLFLPILYTKGKNLFTH